MDSEIITRIIIPIICSFGGILFGIFSHIFWTQRINKIQKYNQIILNNEIEYLKKKLDLYWSIYFKLLICLLAKMQIKKIREISNEFNNMIQIENDLIIKKGIGIN